MARDGTIPTGKLVEMLMKLPIDSRIAVNELGNVICYGADKYLGYIDVVVERFYTVAELAYEQLEREDEDENAEGSFREVYRLHD